MAHFNSNTSLKTKRLVLQPVSEKYKLQICQEFTSDLTRYMPFAPTGNILETEEFIARSTQELEAGTAIHFCILEKKSNEFFGCCGLHDTDKRAVEIGLWLKKSVHGKGYGTETVQGLIKLAEKNLDIEYLFYPVDKSNLASRKIPEKLGFILERSYDKNKSETEVLHIIEYRKKY